MTVYLPSYRIEDEFGYSEERKEYFLDIIKTTANLITEFSKDDGFEHASGFQDWFWQTTIQIYLKMFYEI